MKSHAQYVARVRAKFAAEMSPELMAYLDAGRIIDSLPSDASDEVYFEAIDRVQVAWSKLPLEVRAACHHLAANLD